MTNKLKFVFAGLMVAVALVTTNLSMGTPSASAQSPYCAVNPTLCTPAFCATVPAALQHPAGQPDLPGLPELPGTLTYPCGYVGCIAPILQLRAGAVQPYLRPLQARMQPYPLAYNNDVCGYANPTLQPV